MRYQSQIVKFKHYTQTREPPYAPPAFTWVPYVTPAFGRVPFEICLLHRIIVRFCRECGEQVETTWKFCPHCNSTQQTASVSVQDGVIAGDVTIYQSQIDTSGLKLECPTCKVEGNIKLYPCELEGCDSKACKECMDIYSGFCGPECKETWLALEWERTRPEREAEEKARKEAVEKARKAEEERNARIRKRNQERDARLEKEARRERYALVATWLFLILGFVIIGFSMKGMFETFDDVQCSDGEIIRDYKILDGTEDCIDGSDEVDNPENQKIKEAQDEVFVLWTSGCFFGLLIIGCSAYALKHVFEVFRGIWPNYDWDY